MNGTNRRRPGPTRALARIAVGALLAAACGEGAAPEADAGAEADVPAPTDADATTPPDGTADADAEGDAPPPHDGGPDGSSGDEGGADPCMACAIVSYNANYYLTSPSGSAPVNEERFVPTLERHLDLMDEVGATAVYYFTGPAAEALARWSPELVDRLLASRHGIAYHGANRPPPPQLVEMVAGLDWEDDVATARTYEEDGVSPVTGEHVGGIRAFREVFGTAPFGTGRFFEASILYVDKLNGARMGVGLVDNTGASRDDAWFLGVLDRPTSWGVGTDSLTRAAYEGAQEELLARVRASLAAVDRTRFGLVAVIMHDHDFYPGPGAPDGDAEAVWALYEDVLRTALDLELGFVTLEEVHSRAVNGPAPRVPAARIAEAAEALAAAFEAGAPPEYVALPSGDYLSLAECFEALAVSLDTYRSSGSLPEAVATRDLLGPTAPFEGAAASGPADASSVLDAAAATTSAIVDRVPSSATLAGTPVGPAQLLDVMAQEYASLARTGAPAAVTLRDVAPIPAAVAANPVADPLTKLQFWTFKPALFR